MTEMHLESLDETRREVFDKLSAFKDIGTLGGGTAISLQLGHRRSYDFDIFTREPFDPGLWRRVKRVFGRGCVKTLEIEDQLNLVTGESAAVTFFYDEYKPKYPEIETRGIGLLDLRDLASNKAFTIGKRGKWRDYVDVYFLLTRKIVTLREIIDVSLERSGGEFPVRLFLQQLVYFDDIASYEIDFLGEAVPVEEIKRYLVTEVEALTRE